MTVRRILALDVGNSKTDLVLVTSAGDLLAWRRGPTASQQQVPLARALGAVARLGREALAADGGGRAELLVHCAAGIDLPGDAHRVEAGLEGLDLAASVVVENDIFAALRAGTEAGHGVAVICGAGINAGGLARDGRAFRFPALGGITGDWGGGQDLGLLALGAAVRGADGRGPRTELGSLVAGHFHVSRPLAVAHAIYRGRLEELRLAELVPVVFQAAAAGDGEARRLVDHLADEVALLALVALRHLGLRRAASDVILAGGVFAASEADFHGRIARTIAAGAPRARVRHLEVPPVLGAALLGLDRIGATAEARSRLRDAISRAGGPLGRVQRQA